MQSISVFLDRTKVAPSPSVNSPERPILNKVKMKQTGKSSLGVKNDS